MANSPFDAVVEALATAQNSFDPHNARAVQAWYEGLPDVVDGVSGMLKGHGDKLREEFHMDPAAGLYAQGLGDVFARFHEPVANAGAIFTRAHEADLRRINDPQRNQEKWDITANQE